MIGFAQLSFWFGHAHGMCTAARQHPHAELICVWDEDPERGRTAAERHGVPFIADLDEVLARADVDAVGICSPTHLHAEHVVRAAEAGKHCVVEKPFTRTVAQANQAISAAEKHKIHLMPVYTLRFSPANEKMKEIVDAGTLGPLYQVRRRHGQIYYVPYDLDARRIVEDPDWPWQDSHAEGRRCLYMAGSHAVFWMLWMFGMPESVVNLSTTCVPGLPEEDNNVSVFRYAEGPLVTLTCSQTDTAAPLATEIYGCRGALVQTRGDGPSTQADFGDTSTLMLYTAESNQWEPIPGIDRAFVPPGCNPPLRFFDALAAGEDMPISMYDGQKCVQLLAAAELAEAEKRQVEIAEVV